MYEIERELRAELGRIKRENDGLKEALKECAYDLAAYIEHYYEGTLNYPSQKANYDRDMVPVVRARELLGQTPNADADLPTHHDVRGILK